MPPDRTRTFTGGSPQPVRQGWGWRVAQAWRRLGLLPKLADDPAQQEQVERQALALLLQGRRITLLGTLFGVPLGAWLLDDYIGNAWAWGTAGAMYLAGLESAWHLRRTQHQLAGGAPPGPLARGLIWRVALVGMLFNGWNWPAIDAPNFMATIYVLSIALMVATSSMTQYCIWPAAVTALVTPLLLGLAGRLWWVPDAHGDGRLAGGVFMVALWVMLLAATRRFARAMQSDLLTRLRNEALMTELDTRRQQAEAANHAKTRFLAAASHDLRQPVHAMQLLGGALRDRLAGTPEAPLAQQMNAGVAQFSELVDEIMDLARIDAQAVQAHLAPVSLHAMLIRADTVFRTTAEERGLALWLRAPQRLDASAVLADSALLWRVLGNLLSNALRYTPAGGVMLAVRRARTPGGQPAWRFEVRDSGPGIEPQHRPRIFDEFYRAHDADRSGRNAGHGLGLSVAQRMAGLMGTSVELHPTSTHGSGAVFSITLAQIEPGRDQTAAPAAREPAPFAALPPGLRVLVVDDDPAALQALGALLHGWGVQATLAANLAEAQAALQTHPPLHAVVTDHWLGGGQRSYQVLDWIDQHWPGLPAAVVSGGADSAEVDTIAQRGAVFWRKPLKPDTLHAWLSALSG